MTTPTTHGTEPRTGPAEHQERPKTPHRRDPATAEPDSAEPDSPDGGRVRNPSALTRLADQVVSVLGGIRRRIVRAKPKPAADRTHAGARRGLRSRRNVVASLIALALAGILTAAIALTADPGTPHHQASSPARPAHGPAVDRGGGTPAHTVTPTPTPQHPVGGSTPPPAHQAPSTPSCTAGPQAITLVRGDTLWALAIRHHTSVAELQSLNHLGHSTLILAGHRLLVPADCGSLTPPPAAGATATILAYANAQLGKPYVWGGVGPNGFDCSGLVQQAYAAAGVELPRVTYDQARAGERITRGQLAPGDLVFSNGFGHVQLYLGGGLIIQAASPGTDISISNLPPPGLIDAYVHVPLPT